MSNIDVSPRSAMKEFDSVEISPSIGGCRTTDTIDSSKTIRVMHSKSGYMRMCHEIGPSLSQQPMSIEAPSKVKPWLQGLHELGSVAESNLRFKAAPCNFSLKKRSYMNSMAGTTQVEVGDNKHQIFDGLMKKNKKGKKYFNDLVQELGTSRLTEHELLWMTEAEFIKLITGPKELVLSVQLLLETASPACMATVEKFMTRSLGALIVHRNGSYAVQTLLLHSQTFFYAAINYCRTNFMNLTSNEFASRVMQRLMERNKDFLDFCLRCISKHFDYFMGDFPSVFLVSAAVMLTDDPMKIEFIIGNFSHDRLKWIKNKYFKRVLVTFLSYCNPSTLAQAFEIFKSSVSGRQCFEDKYTSLVLLAFLDRQHREAQSYLYRALTCNLIACLHGKYFDYFIGQLNLKPNASDNISLMYLAFRSVPSTTMHTLSTVSSFYAKYSAIVLVLHASRSLAPT